MACAEREEPKLLPGARVCGWRPLEEVQEARDDGELVMVVIDDAAEEVNRLTSLELVHFTSLLKLDEVLGETDPKGANAKLLH